jgi:membrane protein
MEDLKARLRFLVRLFKETGDRWSEVEGFRLGASFSYYATFAIFPLLLLTVTGIGFVIGDDAAARDRLLSALAAPGSSSRHVLEETMTAMQQSRAARGTSAIIATVSLLFSASGAFIELDATLNKIWGVRPRKGRGVLGTIRTFLAERLTGFTLVLGLGGTLLASLVTSSLLAAIAAHAPERFAPALLQTAEMAASIVLLSGVFALTFHLVPRTRPPFRDVIGGAVLTTVFLTILKTVFAAYLAHLTSYSAYGVVGGVLALATWIYLSSQIIFLGATLTRAHCEARRSCAAAPSEAQEQEAAHAAGAAQAAGE